MSFVKLNDSEKIKELEVGIIYQGKFNCVSGGSHYLMRKINSNTIKIVPCAIYDDGEIELDVFGSGYYSVETIASDVLDNVNDDTIRLAKAEFDYSTIENLSVTSKLCDITIKNLIYNLWNELVYLFEINEHVANGYDIKIYDVENKEAYENFLQNN